MLLVPRPRTRGECLEEARPCPWVGCRHHLLLEVLSDTSKPRKLVLNRPSLRPGQHGRRPGLSSSAAEVLVRVWVDDAIELLTRMRHTCSLDVVDEHGPLNKRACADLLGVTRQGIEHTTARGLVRLRMGLEPDGE